MGGRQKVLTIPLPKVLAIAHPKAQVVAIASSARQKISETRRYLEAKRVSGAVFPEP
jgi:hypothetical protein